MLMMGEEEGLGTCSNSQVAPPRKQESGPELSSRRGEVTCGAATGPSRPLPLLLIESAVATKVGHELLLPLACPVL